MNISIDIGTSYSCCFAQLPDGEVIAIKVSTGISAYGSDTSMPSAVFRPQEGKELLGQAAINSRLLNPASFCKEFKRNLGRSESITLGNKAYSPQDLYTLFFSHMRDRLYQTFPGADLVCYLTCPVNFTENQRDLVLSAAQNAGLFNATLIDEPVAAVQGCRSLSNLKDGDKILVYDFGGGTFDTALVEYTQGSFHALGSEGLSDCGGSNIDWKICQDILKQVPPEQMEVLRADAVAYSRFTVQVNEMAVKAKHHLSYDDVFSDNLPMGFYSLSYTLSRQQLEGMIAQMVANTIASCRNLLQAAKLEVQDLAHVLLVGGTSRIPLVQREVQKLVGAVPWQLVEDPELAVARGALFHDVSQTAWKMYQQGLDSEKRNVPVIALGCYQEAAKAGVAEAQYALARLYQTGIDGFMKPDAIQAEHWYHQAAQQDHTDAMYCLAEICRNGRTRSEEEWLGWYQKAAEQGHRDAQYKLGKHYDKDNQKAEYWYAKAAGQGHADAMRELGELEFEQQNFENAIKWYAMAVEAGNPDAMADLADTYKEMGNHEDAVKWYLLAAEKNSMSAQVYESLGLYCEQGTVLEKSRENAIKWYLRAAERKKRSGGPIGYKLGTLYEETGNYASAAEWYGKVEWGFDQVEEKAKCALARLYYEGKIPGKSVKDAKELFLKLAEKDFPEAQYRLGLYYEEGAEGYPNFKEAEKWYNKASWKKHKAAQYKLGCYWMDKMTGADNPYDEKYVAESYLKKAAEQGYAPALNKYGSILKEDKELEQAVECFRKSAEQGDPEGLFRLALVHQEETYSEHDEEKGLVLLHRSAEAGFDYAQANLGYHYLTKHKKSPGKAAQAEDLAHGLAWYHKAAEQGNHEIQRWLGNLYMDDSLVEKNLSEAEKWYRKSAEQGDQYSMKYLAMLLESDQPEEARLWRGRAAEIDLRRTYEVPSGLWSSSPTADWYRRHARYEEAYDMYRNGAEYGIATSLFALAEFYEQGLYVSRNKGTAEDYYKQAYNAHSWDPKSKIRQESAYRLACYYESIRFPFPRKKLAEEWYSKAAEAGHEGAQRWLEAKQQNI